MNHLITYQFLSKLKDIIKYSVTIINDESLSISKNIDLALNQQKLLAQAKIPLMNPH